MGAKAWSAIVALAMLAAGCVADEPEPAAVECDGPLDDCVTCRDCGECPPQATCDVEGPRLTIEDEPREPITETFSFDGNTGMLACPPELPMRGHCAAALEAAWEPPELGGLQPLALQADVTPQGDVPSTQRYYVSLVVRFPQNDTWEWDPTREPGVEGALPLAADFDLAPYPERTRFLVWVEAWHEAGPATVVTPEDYRVEGQFTHLGYLH